jgi:maltose alpha-D-glucosyltransferase/alpha-amylase
MALRQGDASPIHWAIDQIPGIPSGCQWCTFLRNHDELTLEMVTPEEREWMWREYAPEKRLRLNLGIRRRLAPLLDNNIQKIELANAIIFSLPGTPIIYYGDEIGMGDNIELPDRNGVRTPMQWNGSTSAGFSNSLRSYSPVISNPAFAPEKVNVELQRNDPGSLWNFLHKMIGVRKKHLAFGLGSLEWVETHSKAGLAYWREWRGDRLLCVNNLSEHPLEIHLPVKSPAQELTDQLTGRVYSIREGWLSTTLRGYEFLWLG